VNDHSFTFFIFCYLAIFSPQVEMLKRGKKLKQNKPKYQQIINAAVIVFAEKGYHQAKVSRIAKEAGVADGTIYLYFKNKEDILISIFKEKMGEFIEKIEEDIAGKSLATEKLLSMVHMHLTLLAADPQLAVVTQLELRQVNKGLRQRINEALKGYLALIDQILKAGIEEGTFDRVIDVRLSRQMIFGTIDEVVTNWIMSDQKFDLSKQVTPIHQLLINGIKKHD
jgi:TetR/AcrR family fatty acid metabolism transcriptional regulator